MFDFDGAKLLIIGIIMLIVIKPKDLPMVMRQIGRTVGQLRRMASEFQGQFHEAMREAEMADLKKDVEKMTNLDVDGLNPFDSVRGALNDTKAEIDAKLNEPQSPPPVETASSEPPPMPAPVNPVSATPAVAPPAPEAAEATHQ